MCNKIFIGIYYNYKGFEYIDIGDINDCNFSR